MTEDEAKEELFRLTSPLNTVCHMMKLFASNDTAFVREDDQPDPSMEGWRRGIVRFTIRVIDGHKPPSFVRDLLQKFNESNCKWKGMTLVQSEHKSLRDSSLVYDAEFIWKI